MMIFPGDKLASDANIVTDPGIYPDLSERDYYAIRDGRWPALNQTLANVLLKQSPAHAHAKFTGWSDEERTKSLAIGSVVHKLLLGRGKRIIPIDAKDFRTKAAQEARDAAYDAGDIPIIKHEFIEAEECADAVRDQLAQRGILLNGQSEVAIVWRSEGVLCKGMLDHLLSPCGMHADVYDLKSIVSADPDTCQRHCITYGYDVQRAGYIEGLETLKPELAGRLRYSWIFFETSPPYSVAVRRARGTMRERGERRWRRAVREWRECTINGSWRGYDDSDLECPPWAIESEFDGNDI